MADITVGLAKPFVSVVIPCYNSKKTIGDCLTSLANQRYPKDKYEVVVADNGSSDGSPEFMSSSFPWVRVIHCSEKGSGYARNAGIREARGELILSTDADCVPDKDWIIGLVSAFDVVSPEVASIGGRIIPYSLKTSVEYHQPAWPSQPDLKTIPAGTSFAATPNAGFRTSAIRQVGGFDGTLGFDDTDLGIRLQQHGYKIDYTALAVVQHRNPVAIRELYRHRAKYGAFGYTISKKHPELLGNPLEHGARKKLLRATIRRIVGDLFIKLPVALVAAPPNRPRIWPVLDAAMALGNYVGYARAVKEAEGSARK